MASNRYNFQSKVIKYRPLLKRALLYFLEDEGEAETATAGAMEQAARQWEALEGEANPLHLIGLASADQCALLLPRPEGETLRNVPTAAQIVRHLEWYDWEGRVDALKVTIAVREASVREAGRNPEEDPELAEFQTKLSELISTLFRAQLGLSDEDDNAPGGTPCAVTVPPPQRDPGGGRTFEVALAPARNP